jgi:hypothetical protein
MINPSIIIILLFSFTSLWAVEYNEFRIDDDEFYELVSDPAVEYIFRLYSADIIKGYITEFTKDDEKGEGIKIVTYAGEIELYHNQIIEVSLATEKNRHRHREYLMPTARPIEDDHFVGNWQVGLLYGGFGVSEYLSVTGGVTVVPGVESQVWLMNLKGTFLNYEFEDEKGGLAVSAGYNHTNIGGVDLGHAYANASFWGERTNFTAILFGRVTPVDEPESFVLLETVYPIDLAQGAIGVGFGMDTRFSTWTDLRFVGELWSPDLSRATQSAVLAGLRLDNETVAYDFGLMFITSPLLIPYFAFSWTPF